MHHFRQSDQWSERMSKTSVMFCARAKGRRSVEMLVRLSGAEIYSRQMGSGQLPLQKSCSPHVRRNSQARDGNTLVPVARRIFRARETRRELSLRGGKNKR